MTKEQIIQLLIQARAKGTDKQYREYIQHQPSCISGEFSEWVNGEGRCIAAHVRRAGESGVGCKAEYACVPLTQAEHDLQHQCGERASIEVTNNYCHWVTPKEAKAWFDEQRVRYLKMWIAS